MKNKLATFLTLLFFAFAQASNAQTSIEDILDKAVSLGGQKANLPQMANLLQSGVAMLEKETATGDAAINGKILSQLGNLKSLIPSALAGKLDVAGLGKIANTIKVLVAVNRLKSMLKGGKSGLLGKSTGLLSNLNLLKAGSSVLGSGLQDQFGKLLGSTTKSVGKLDKSGILGKIAASASNKKMGKLLNLVTSAL